MPTTVLTALVLSSMLGSGDVRQTRPASDVFTVTDYEAPPPSLQGLWDHATVIARVRVENDTQSMRQKFPGRGSSILTVRTDHQVSVIELLKAPPTLLNVNSLRITLPVGTATVGGRSYRSESSELAPLAVGREYIVFLKPWPAAGSYELAYGPAGAYLVEDDSIRIPKRVAHWKSFAGRSRILRSEMQGLLSDLRSRTR